VLQGAASVLDGRQHVLDVWVFEDRARAVLSEERVDDGNAPTSSANSFATRDLSGVRK
jgi:hypothetical protein